MSAVKEETYARQLLVTERRIVRLRTAEARLKENEGWHLVPGVPAVAVCALGGTLSTKGFSTVRVPPRNAL